MSDGSEQDPAGDVPGNTGGDTTTDGQTTATAAPTPPAAPAAEGTEAAAPPTATEAPAAESADWGFDIPESLKEDAVFGDEFKRIAKESGVSPDAAKKIYSYLESKSAESASMRDQQAQKRDAARQKALDSIGKEVQERARGALQKVTEGDEQLAKAFAGVEKSPSMVRMLARVADIINQEGHVTGDGQMRGGTPSRKSTLAARYPSMAK